MRVTIYGYADGPTFDAYRIDVAGSPYYNGGYYAGGGPYDDYSYYG